VDVAEQVGLSVGNTIDAIAAQTIFHLPILGEFRKCCWLRPMLIEFYLAIVLDAAARPTGAPLKVSMESALELLQQVVVDQEFSPFYADG